MKTICSTLLASVALSLQAFPDINSTTLPDNIKKAMQHEHVNGANNILIRTDIATGWIDPDICTNDCWRGYV